MCAWDYEKPAGSQKLRLSDDDIRANWAAIEAVFGLLIDDAVSITASADELNNISGVRYFSEQGSDPTTIANQGALFTKAVTAVTELFFAPEGAAAVVQLTRNGGQPNSRPAGELTMWAGASGSVPTGWLLCNGQAVSRTTYAALYTAIGTGFGVGDGSTTFNVPDLRDRLPIGVGTAIAATLAATGGDATKDISHVHATSSHTLLSAECGQKAISVAISNTTNTTGVAGSNRIVVSNQADTDDFSFSITGSDAVNGHTHGDTASGGSDAQDVMNPYIGVHYIIRT